MNVNVTRLLGRFFSISRWSVDAAALCIVLSIAACAQQTKKSESAGTTDVSNASSAETRSVLRFLVNLKRVAEQDLLDNPRQIEEVMGFRIVGWRNSAEDNSYFLDLMKTREGSFGGMAAFMPRAPGGQLKATLQFTPVRGSELQPQITTALVREVFGPPDEALPPSDFHKVSGGRLRYVLSGQADIEVTFDIASSRDPFIASIAVHRVVRR